MCAPTADGGLLAGKAVKPALQRGLKWLMSLMDSSGQLAGSDQASLYSKVPAALVAGGELGAALRCLDWIERRFIDSQGDFAAPEGQPPARSYDRGWLVWGASLCGRYDLAFPLADHLAGRQSPATGGFWDSVEESSTGRGTHHAMTSGMAGLGLLSVRHVEAAARAAQCLIQLLELQPEPREGVQLVLQVGEGGRVELGTQRNSADYIDLGAGRQRPARIGPAQVLLLRLYRLSKETRYLEASRRYSSIFLEGAPGIYDCVESHKFLWGLEELHQVAPDPRFRAAADRISRYIVSRQQPDGQWFGDAVGDSRPGQSLELRLNTTCNALVGLAFHHQMAG